MAAPLHFQAAPLSGLAGNARSHCPVRSWRRQTARAAGCCRGRRVCMWAARAVRAAPAGRVGDRVSAVHAGGVRRRRCTPTARVAAKHKGNGRRRCRAVRTAPARCSANALCPWVAEFHALGLFVPVAKAASVTRTCQPPALPGRAPSSPFRAHSHWCLAARVVPVDTPCTASRDSAGSVLVSCLKFNHLRSTSAPSTCQL